MMDERWRYPSRRNGSPSLLRGPPVAAYSWIGRARNRAHIARCAAEPAAIVPAELRLVAEPPLVGDFGDALPAVRIPQHGITHQQTLVADVGAHRDAFPLKDLVQIPERDAGTVCHHLWREPCV